MITSEKGLNKLSTKISSERYILLNQFNVWEKTFEQKPSVREIIELTQLEDLLERMIHKRLYRKEEDVIAYAAEAKQLVEKMEKDS